MPDQHKGSQTDPIIVEQLVEAPLQKVWDAITRNDEMKLWYFDLPGFTPEYGYEFSFSGGPAEDRQYLHICEITEVKPLEKLTYSWRYDGYEGISFVSFCLEPEGNFTHVTLIHEGVHTFPASNPDLARENFVAGWNDIIKVSLKNHLEKS